MIGIIGIVLAIIFLMIGSYKMCIRDSAYKAAVEIVGGEQYILSAVMHADERNRAMSEALGAVSYTHLDVYKRQAMEPSSTTARRAEAMP